MHYRRLWLLLGLAYIILILTVSLIRVPEVDVISFESRDKFIHFLMYFILVAWFAQLYEKNSQRLIILLGAISLGMLTEVLQGMTSYRSFDYWDELANSAGAICAFLLARSSFDSLLEKIDQQIHQSRKNTQKSI
jgi:glycopeptide antibiotics resistance protein